MRQYNLFQDHRSDNEDTSMKLSSSCNTEQTTEQKPFVLAPTPAQLGKAPLQRRLSMAGNYYYSICIKSNCFQMLKIYCVKSILIKCLVRTILYYVFQFYFPVITIFKSIIPYMCVFISNEPVLVQ